MTGRQTSGQAICGFLLLRGRRRLGVGGGTGPAYIVWLLVSGVDERTGARRSAARELDLSRVELSPGALRTAPCVQLQWQFTHVATLLAVAGNGEMQPSLSGEHHQRKHAALLQARALVAAWFTLRLK
ncbi:hypothetical protein MHYP_G00295560 [Metynnis hypsauchen]